jgi:predicted regulator of Ras-like GTPase activity (Roadblock/LC7/MglB family)
MASGFLLRTRKMSEAEDLRHERMAFYEKDMEPIAKAMQSLLQEARALGVMLVDKDGHMITREGTSTGYDPETVSALVAGSFAATKQVAKMLGEEEFSILFHQGKRDNIQLSLVDDRVILAVVFDDQTTIGMVRLCADQAVRRLTAIFRDIEERRERGEDSSEEIAEGYNEEAQDKVDDVFKDAE